MINRKRRAELYREAHRLQWEYDLVKLIKWGLIIVLVPIVILAMLDPVNWPYMLLALVVGAVSDR